eukprot:CAMPEP_0182444124 /NCGR_PEP_ID=MMETSP1172-20130603/2674_1 /TAXON_ID=708627 /ORGANISM="Timspurckia oligopyrenoides, Strain CCMP3278" /LENGTH=229 /DNA_ID=CAMNT_0024639611 /DNA_START=1090 /DNA_END=1779 /DNA_ORIENTATION=+
MLGFAVGGVGMGSSMGLAAANVSRTCGKIGASKVQAWGLCRVQRAGKICGEVFVTRSHRNEIICTAKVSQYEAVEIIENVIDEKSVPPHRVMEALDALQHEYRMKVAPSDVDGFYQLLWTSGLIKVPILRGKMPVYETVEIRGVGEAQGCLELRTTVVGPMKSRVPSTDEYWHWDAESQVLEFSMKKGKPAKTWEFFYSNDTMLLVQSSSFTGFNILKRLQKEENHAAD